MAPCPTLSGVIAPQASDSALELAAVTVGRFVPAFGSRRPARRERAGAGSV